MRSIHMVSVVVLGLMTGGAGRLLAQCTAPTTPGVRICAPTNNSTVVYQPGIQFNSTPASGSIVKFILYDNGKDEFEGAPFQTGVILYDANIRNGRHHIVINAWDTGGHLLQSSVTFTIIGAGYPLFCSAPASPGLNFCVPPANSVQSGGIPVSGTATGYSKITTLQVYLDGVLQISRSGPNSLSSGVPAAPGKHTVTMVAWDSGGHRFAASRSVLSTYGEVDCPPKGNNPCSPGFVVDSPVTDEFTGQTITLKASIQNNPRPITVMKVYLDWMQVAQAGGPTIYQTITTGLSGTHFLTFQAWDTAGTLYRVQQNVNINVPH